MKVFDKIRKRYNLHTDRLSLRKCSVFIVLLAFSDLSYQYWARSLSALRRRKGLKDPEP